MATNRMPDVCFGMCDVGDVEIIDDGRKVTCMWKVHITFITDFPQMSSRWCQWRGGEFRLFKITEGSNIYLAIMREKPSFFVYDVRMGLIADDSEKFSVSGQISPSSCFHKERLCSLDDLRIGRSQDVKLFCEIQKKRNIESISASVYSNKAATTGASGSTRTDAENKTRAEAGTSTADIGETAEDDAARKLTGVRPKEIRRKQQENRAIETTGASGSASRDPERIARAERAGAARRERVQTNLQTSPRREAYNGIPGKKLAEDMRKLLQEGYAADVVFLVKDGECRGHLVILWARLPYFREMVENLSDGAISYRDCTTRGFNVYLDYVYTGTVDMLSPSNVFEVLFIAEKFDDGRLKAECFETMTINLDNFIKVEELLLNYESKELEDAAFRFFCKNKTRIPGARGFERFLKENPDIVSRLFLEELKNA